ncbi:MAG: dephospho-CoA kinase [Chromatiaceae bacterium]|nr:MAG: dephospho-CoA kinase [Chromatiaceae bacterium]
MAESNYRIALTGGIGSGKSSASDLFAARGASVIDADRISHALTAPGAAALADIAAAFGKRMLAPDGALDRAALRQLVFADPAARRRLEAILHPRIRDRMLAAAAAAPGPYAILSIPLLFETGQQALAARVLVVDLPEDLQVARVMARSGLSADEVRRIIASQVSRAERLAGADDIIDNSGPPAALAPQVADLHQRYLALAAAS